MLSLPAAKENHAKHQDYNNQYSCRNHHNQNPIEKIVSAQPGASIGQEILGTEWVFGVTLVHISPQRLYTLLFRKHRSVGVRVSRSIEFML